MRDDQTEPSADDPLGPIVESYLARWRRGERPTPGDYAARHPDLADRIHSLFPAIGGLERLAGAERDADDAPDPLPVSRFPAPFGRYDLLQELGRGGMGVVYQAWDRDARRVVALKVIRPGTLEDARFRVEAGVLARLEHDHVVPLHDVGEHDGVRFFTMRFVGGGDLNGRAAEYAVPRAAARPEAEEAIRRVAGLLDTVGEFVRGVWNSGFGSPVCPNFPKFRSIDLRREFANSIL